MRQFWKVLLVVGLVGTFAQAQVTIFRDNFDTYANDAEMSTVWQVYAGGSGGTLSTAQAASAPNSLYHAGTTGNNRYHVFADDAAALVATAGDPILWKFKFYDDGVTNKRKTCSLLTSQNWSGVTDKWLEFGVMNTGTGNTTYYIRQVNMGGPLTDPCQAQGWCPIPTPARSVGWRDMRALVYPDRVEFTVDGNAAYTLTPFNATNVKFKVVACGGPSNLYSLGGGAYFDDVHVSLLSKEFYGPGCNDVPPVAIGEILLSDALTVNVVSVDPSATKVSLYKSSTGAEPWTPISERTDAPFASTVAMPVPAPGLVAGDTILATQNVTVTLPGFPPTDMEGCKVPDPKNVVDGCAQIPVVNIVGLVDQGREIILVKGVDPAASAVTVYAFAPGNPPTLIGAIGSNTSPGGESLVSVNVTALVLGQIIRATQTVSGIEGCVPSTGGRTVGAPGIIEDFEGSVLRYDHPAPGRSAAWYDVSFQSYTDVLIPPHARATMPNGSKCVNITDHGWTNGAYVIYEDIIPAAGDYHLVLDMLIDEPIDLDPDFYSQYQVGVIVNGVHREAAGGIVPSITSPIGKYPCLTPLRDGVGIDPIQVYVDTFTAAAGDDLLLAFATDVNGYVRNKSATPAGYVGMKVDNIRLVEGPKPAICTDVPVVEIVPNATYALEAGVEKVTVRNIAATATLVEVLADNEVIGSVAPGGASQLDVPVTPLVAGKTILGSQTVDGIASCQCPGAIGPVVGEGVNSGLKIALGIRETGPGGGTTGTIEWVGATAKGTSGEPIGRALPTDTDWQTVTFAWPSAGGSDPVTGFTGDGVVTGTHGVLESLNFTIDGANTGRYKIYIDTIMNGSTVIADFDSDAVGTLTVFRKPRNSGSTDTNLMVYPDVAEVSADEAADGAQSYRVEWQFIDNNVKRWLRLTSVSDTTVPMPIQDPIIDLSQPVTVKLLLYGAPECGEVFADADIDGDVDMDDFAAFQRCITNGLIPVLPECGCFDRPFNGVIGLDDLTSFNNCASGANVPADPACDD